MKIILLIPITLFFLSCGSRKTNEQVKGGGDINPFVADSITKLSKITSDTVGGLGTTGTVDNMLGHCTLDTSNVTSNQSLTTTGDVKLGDGMEQNTIIQPEDYRLNIPQYVPAAIPTIHLDSIKALISKRKFFLIDSVTKEIFSIDTINQ